MRDATWVEDLWYGTSVGARLARAALTPAELLFRLARASRSLLYDVGVLPAHAATIPALSVGNLTVGGTGKTPLAAHVARRFRDLGARPAMVLRGYGADEPEVHRILNPDVPVIVGPDRAAGTVRASELGCDVAVLDDAFQHRRATRVADVVIVSADAWREGRRHLLPAGPWREPLSALRRSSLVVVTRKAASFARAESVLAVVTRTVPVPGVIAYLRPDELRRADGPGATAVTALRGERVLAVSGVGDPSAFHAQLVAEGAVVAPATFRDHHRYSERDVSRLVTAAATCDRVVCTLKDAVKLGALWPGPTPLWYVSQRVDVECGRDSLEAVLAATLAARSSFTHPGRPGSPGPPD